VARESIQDKGRRYLTEGRLQIEKVDDKTGWVIASCRGTDSLYHLGYDPGVKQFRCTCQARGACAHIYALRSVVIR
jgi:uncharacterized Zn finger protein